MGIFLSLLQYGLGLLPSIVLGVQTLAGDKASGSTKLTMAKDALSVALGGAASVLPQGSAEVSLAQGAASAVATILASAGAINAAVTHTKATGAYQAATTAATTLAATPATDATNTA